ncbi:S-adenosyl-L-methionine-dependent methyltransferase [Westerdykella ornata]|uniref:Histone-lysine N-methyltransferase, H3 lysine-79 specific n=1 Tax=Westerdykella ornata TaxID=318751 RepID=A0A6A6JK21_WESOR|nr:S-adenosyl-L-methionine-dependent methyltransferase [Westerdykella ornata]KAF2276318.1 S-adenosyl-L-methionine-dependent methyltransferase [Westerdykella ornata]
MFGATASKPKIRTRTVLVPVQKQPLAGPSTVAPNGSPRITPSNALRKASGTPPAHARSLTSARSNSKLRAGSESQSTDPPQQRRKPRLQQRKRKVTPSTPQWGTSDDEPSDDGDDDKLGSGLRKRQKTSSSIEPARVNRCLEPDLKRRIRHFDISDRQEGSPVAEGPTEETEGKVEKLRHGMDLSTGDWAKDFKPAFPDNENLVVELQYPSPSLPEKFATVVPRDTSNYNPLDDIYFSIEEILAHYLPAHIAVPLQSETTGTVRLLKRAVFKQSPQDFQSALSSFNTLIRQHLQDGSIQETLNAMHAIPLSLIQRILAQVYLRTVSPYAHLLRRVESKQTTYGELLPPFIHTIFAKTHLSSTSIFVDLGSGVGNVVLQSALQTGAESWGIEILERPARFALDQAAELRARAKRWNLALGEMHLLHGSFLESPEIDKVLQRADVVLVNNKVFDNETNTILLNKFLDLKLGACVVSLESFCGGAGGGGVGQGGRNENAIASLFEEERFESGTSRVNWTDESVEWFLARKVR